MKKSIKARRRSLAVILAVVAVVVVLLAVSVRGDNRTFRNIMNATVGRVQSYAYRLGSSLSPSEGTISNDERSLALLELAQIKRENESLRAHLAFADRTPLTFIGADVARITSDGARRSFEINQGSEAGVAPGMAVVAGGYFIGTVSQVTDDTATVLLVSDPTFRASGMVADSGAVGLLRGQAGAGLALEKVASHISPEAGSIVVTSALGGELPKGLPVGKVVATESNPNSVFVTARISLPIDFTNVETVLVITNE